MHQYETSIHRRLTIRLETQLSYVDHTLMHYIEIGHTL